MKLISIIILSYILSSCQKCHEVTQKENIQWITIDTANLKDTTVITDEFKITFKVSCSIPQDSNNRYKTYRLILKSGK